MNQATSWLQRKKTELAPLWHFFEWALVSGWGVVALGLMFAFGASEAGHRVVGLILLALGVLMVGMTLFGAWFEPTISIESGVITRTLGQMFIATFLNFVLASGLAAAIIAVGMDLNTGHPDRAPLDGTTMAWAAFAFTLQGLALTLYAWWHWFGQRRPPSLVDELAQVLADDRVATDAKIAAAKDELAAGIAAESAQSARKLDALIDQQAAINALNERFDRLEVQREQDEIRHLNELRRMQRGDPIS